MLTINLVGFGHLGRSLVYALSALQEVEVCQIVSSRQFVGEDAIFEAKRITNIGDLSAADLTILAVPDGEIRRLSDQLPYSHRMVVHTSGSIDLQQLSKKNQRGVWYPLQTFRREQLVDFSEVPIGVEGENEEVKTVLLKLAHLLSHKVYEINSSQRIYLHIIAVFLNNFTNHLVDIGQKLAKEQAIPFEIFEPLLQQTYEKWQKIPAEKAQTGPAKRGDQITIEKHKKILSSHRDYQKIYEILSDSIQKNGEKL